MMPNGDVRRFMDAPMDGCRETPSAISKAGWIATGDKLFSPTETNWQVPGC